MWCLEKLLDKVYEHLYFEKTANPVVELDVPGFFCHHNGKSPKGLTNITTGDRCLEGEGTRGRAPTTAAPKGRHLKKAGLHGQREEASNTTFLTLAIMFNG